MTSSKITRAALRDLPGDLPGNLPVAAVLDLVQACRTADGVTPLSEHVLLHLRYDSTGADSTGAPEPAGEPGQDFVLTVDGDLAGYAYLDPPAADPHSGTAEVSGELMIGPDHRRHGLGRALAAEAAAAVDAAGGGYELRLWAHGDLPAAAALAATTGFERFRALWQMRRPLDQPLAEPALPAGRTLRAFVPGQDEDDWLALNARAFAKHPEQGGWARHDLELREQEPWFDPAGFFIAEKDGVMTGFHWTKVHPPEPAASGPGLGEVYVVGVDPAEQGSGLGRALTLAGLHHLRDRGVDEAMLYVDEDNVPAIRMYEALGFTRATVDAMYRRPDTSSPVTR
jgi:mycothiol synthase